MLKILPKRKSTKFYSMNNSVSPPTNQEIDSSADYSSWKKPVLPRQQERWFKWGIIEGGLSAVYSSFCGGVFLIGLAVAWGADEVIVGVISASPFFAMIATFVGTWLLEKGISRRAVSMSPMLIARLLWLSFGVFYPFFVLGRFEPNLVVLIILTLLSALLGAVGQIAWLGWMNEIVPLETRGRYFGIRNAVFGLMTTVTTYLGGKLVNWNFGRSGEPESAGYFGIFFIGGVAGVAGIIALRQVGGGKPEPSVGQKISFWRLLKIPFENENFRRFLLFQFVWMFGVYMSAPFFAVVMLKKFNAGIEYVGLVTAVGALANVITFRGWGILADHYGNRPIMFLCCLFSGFFPMWWLFLNPNNYYAPLIVFHFLAGISWAGYTLASYNLLLKLSPIEHNSIYLSLFNSFTGVSTTLAPIVGGLLAFLFEKLNIGKLIYPLFVVFIVSTVLRYSSITLLRRVKEPQEASLLEVLRVLRSARGFNTLMGFDVAIHFLSFKIGRENKK